LLQNVKTETEESGRHWGTCSQIFASYQSVSTSVIATVETADIL